MSPFVFQPVTGVGAGTNSSLPQALFDADKEVTSQCDSLTLCVRCEAKIDVYMGVAGALLPFGRCCFVVTFTLLVYDTKANK